MNDKTSIKLSKRFAERFEAFRKHYGFSSFNGYVRHVIQEDLRKREEEYEIYEEKKRRVERADI